MSKINACWFLNVVCWSLKAALISTSCFSFASENRAKIAYRSGFLIWNFLFLIVPLALLFVHLLFFSFILFIWLPLLLWFPQIHIIFVLASIAHLSLLVSVLVHVAIFGQMWTATIVTYDLYCIERLIDFFIQWSMLSSFAFKAARPSEHSPFDFPQKTSSLILCHSYECFANA